MTVLQNILNTLSGIIASFLLFWSALLSGHAVPAPIEQTATSTLQSSVIPAAATTTTQVKSQVGVQKSGPPASGGLAETGNPRTFVTPPATQPPTSTSVPVVPTKPQEQVNDDTRAALVNILCMPQTGINGISGSGVIVDSRGVILTNAHVAQFFLLRNYLVKDNITCTIRVGSPAQERYTATLLYLPPAWIAANASQLKASQATGTGEDDFAFLLITGRTDGSALPASFPRLEMDRGYVDIGDPMLLAAYPAGFLGAESVQKSLYASSAIAYVTQLFSFTQIKSVDLFSVGGTVVSQGGSSGGAAVRLRDGSLAGIISTETTAASTGERDLRAVSLAHIDNELRGAGLGGISELLSGNLSAKAATFNTQIAPAETATLEAVLKGN